MGHEIIRQLKTKTGGYRLKVLFTKQILDQHFQPIWDDEVLDFNLAEPMSIEAINGLLMCGYMVRRLTVVTPEGYNFQDLVQGLRQRWFDKLVENHDCHAEINKLRNIIQEGAARMSFAEDNNKGLLVPFHSVKGGKTGRGDDWLSSLKEGTRCLVKRLTQMQDPRTGQVKEVENYDLLEIEIINKITKSVCIQVTYNGTSAEVWVDPIIYCQTNYLHEILETPE